jgi:hypothetical protein
MTYTVTIRVYDLPNKEKAQEMVDALLDAFMDADTDGDFVASGNIEEDEPPQ